MASIIVMEVRPRVQACNIAVTSPQHGASLQLYVHPRELIMEWTMDGSSICKWTASFPADLNLKLQPQSLSTLALQEATISFRLQTEPELGAGLSGSFSTEVIALENSFSKSPDAPKSISPRQTYCVLCGCCRKNLLTSDDVIFQRVLPLPSSHCDVDDFFCHKHSHDNSSEESGIELSADPKEMDFLYSLCSFELHKSLFGTVDPVIRCKRCLSWLGTCNANRVSLWNCTSIVEEVGKKGDLKLTSHPAHDFLAIVKEAIQSSIALACRIILQVKLTADCVQYLLLWVIDRELILLTARAHAQADLVKHKTAKVSFRFEKVKSQVVSLWMNDTRVHVVEVAFPIVVHGLRLLTATSQLIPAANRQVQDGFLLAYLCADFIDW